MCEVTLKRTLPVVSSLNKVFFAVNPSEISFPITLPPVSFTTEKCVLSKLPHGMPFILRPTPFYTLPPPLAPLPPLLRPELNNTCGVQQQDRRAPKLSQGLPVCDWLCLLPTLRAGRAKTKILKCNKKFQHEGGYFHPHWSSWGPDGQRLLVSWK